MIFELAGLLLADRPATRRLPRRMHGLAASGDQIMPFRQGLSSGAQPIGAGLGKPVERPKVAAIELHAIGDALHPVLIVEAAAVPAIEQLAGDVRRIEEAGLLILELVHAATAAAVAQRLPLAAVERGQGLFPEWRPAVHDKSSLALLIPPDQAGIARG